MKKILLSLFALCCAMQLFSQTLVPTTVQPKKAIIEEFTGALTEKHELGVLPKGKNAVTLKTDLPAGIYFLQLDIDGQLHTKKMILTQ